MFVSNVFKFKLCSEIKSDLLLGSFLLQASELLLSAGQSCLDHRKDSAEVVCTPLT